MLAAANMALYEKPPPVSLMSISAETLESAEKQVKDVEAPNVDKMDRWVWGVCALPVCGVEWVCWVGWGVRVGERGWSGMGGGEVEENISPPLTNSPTVHYAP
jgi:hypothetical protein